MCKLAIENLRKQNLNKNLTSKVEQIFKLEESTNKNMYKIARIMFEINEKKLYEEDGFKSASAMAEQILGYRQQTASTLIRVGGKFINEKGQPNVLVDGEPFTFYQYQELLPLDIDVITEAITNKVIEPTMTVSAIRSAVKLLRGIEDKSNKESIEQKQESNTESEPEQTQEEPKVYQAENKDVFKFFLDPNHEYTSVDIINSVTRVLAELANPKMNLTPDAQVTTRDLIETLVKYNNESINNEKIRRTN